MVYSGTQLSTDFSTPMKTTCSGNLYDRQRVTDWIDNKGCGYYEMSTNSTALAIQHAITIKTPSYSTFHTINSSSLKIQHVIFE